MLAPALAQDFSIPGVPADGNVSVEQLQSAVTAVEARQELDDETRGRVIEQLHDAEAQIRNRTSAVGAAANYAQSLESAPAETESLRQNLEQEVAPAPTPADLGINDDTVLADLEQTLTREMAEQAAVAARLSELESRIEDESGRPAVVRDRIIELRANGEALATAAQAAPPSGEEPLLTDARALATELRRRAQVAEISRLEQETLSHTARLDLLRAQRDTAARTQIEVERRVEILRTEVNAKRQSTAVLAQEAAVAAELAAADKHPAVLAVATANAELTLQMPAVAADIERITLELKNVDSEASDIEQKMSRSQQRLDVGGLSRVIGRLLLEDKRNLPQVSQYRSDVRSRRDALAEIGLAQVRIQEDIRELTPLDGRVNEIMAEVALDVDDEQELAETRVEVRSMLRDQRGLLNQRDSNYRSYLQMLGDLDVAQRRLLDSAGDYQEFLDQNLMWIPSAAIVGTGDWRDVGPAAARALSPVAWATMLVAVLDSLRDNVAAAVLGVLLLGALILSRRPLVARFRTMNSSIGRLSEDNIGLTFRALAMAAVHALPVPLALAMVGWLLVYGPDQTPFIQSVEKALLGVAPFMYNLLLLRIFVAENGIAQVHFDWRKENLAIVRRQLDRLLLVGIPLAFATIMLYASEVAADRATLGRAAYVALMVTLSMTLYPLSQPNTGVAAAAYRDNPHMWESRLRWLWFALAAVGPLALGLLAMFGYIYSSSMLTGLLVDTIWLVIAMVVVNLVVLRWLALARRKIAWQLALKERAAKLEERAAKLDEQNNDGDDDAVGEVPVVASKPLDLEAVDVQTRKLLQSGLFLVGVIAGWTIWAEVLPAFNLLNRVVLWTKIVTIDGVETIAPVALSGLLLGILVAAVTTVAYKNLPGLMEIVLLQRLTLEPGSHYAINTLVRYVVVTVGTFSVLNIIGWNWSQIQWLVAALSVGLGFGLQEIVANFVSGLIILFERPVRVGDTVTVGTLTGTVTKVRIRATTITDWDRKEIIVPNKSFITEQVINWTLSDPITRIVVKVGISYGSDVELAHRVMNDTLRALPLVLEEPEPVVYFMGFGESSLDFKLFVYSRQLSDRLPIMHAVHESILAALREHKIEIPFPQRDLHLRSTVQQVTPQEDEDPRPASDATPVVS